VTDGSKPVLLVGLVRPRGHCAFTWEEPERGGPRVARVTSTHCAECVQELRDLAYVLVPEDAGRSGASNR
jgi:hypothetical protein